MALYAVPQHAPTNHPLEPAVKGRLLDYLSNGRLVWAARAQTPDEHNPGAPHITVATLTDGTFVWSNHFASYVERHDLQVPDALVAAAVAHGFVIPDLTDAQLEAIRERLRCSTVLDLAGGSER